MGEPATPPSTERQHTRAYAASVIEAVRNDEDQPLSRYEDGDAMPDDETIFRLSQEVTLLLSEAQEIRETRAKAADDLRFALLHWKNRADAAEADLYDARRTGVVSSGGKSEARRERHVMETERDAARAHVQRVQGYAAILKERFAGVDLHDDVQEALDNLMATAEARPAITPIVDDGSVAHPFRTKFTPRRILASCDLCHEAPDHPIHAPKVR
jgi:hypothetical protein